MMRVDLQCSTRLEVIETRPTEAANLTLVGAAPELYTP